MVVGQNLPDGKVKIKVSNSGIEMIDMELNIVNRKVETIETIEAAGSSFLCSVISQESKMTSKAMGIPINMNFKIKEWFSPKAGMVKKRGLF